MIADACIAFAVAYVVAQCLLWLIMHLERQPMPRWVRWLLVLPKRKRGEKPKRKPAESILSSYTPTLVLIQSALQNDRDLAERMDQLLDELSCLATELKENSDDGTPENSAD